ncbi:MAG TPA: hypothetical protein VJ348_00840 [Candidatus Humimicrobiaceae bacterium]|nr:hypothetical protein [Candidatus Humimicrobiaceae bacterium]
MYNHVLYLSYWIINFIIIFLVSKIFPGNVVLGTWRFTGVEAAIYSSFWLTFFIWVVWDFMIAKGFDFSVDSLSWIYFFVINAAGIWMVARFAWLLGMGISSFVWAIIIGILVTVAQRLTWGIVTRRQLKY